jgi:hypothetical protein
MPRSFRAFIQLQAQERDIFHNLLLGRKEVDVEHLMKVMQVERKEDLEA